MGGEGFVVGCFIIGDEARMVKPALLPERKKCHGAGKAVSRYYAESTPGEKGGAGLERFCPAALRRG